MERPLRTKNRCVYGRQRVLSLTHRFSISRMRFGQHEIHQLQQSWRSYHGTIGTAGTVVFPTWGTVTSMAALPSLQICRPCRPCGPPGYLDSMTVNAPSTKTWPQCLQAIATWLMNVSPESGKCDGIHRVIAGARKPTAPHFIRETTHPQGFVFGQQDRRLEGRLRLPDH